jgi:hypothetical protein
VANNLEAAEASSRDSMFQERLAILRNSPSIECEFNQEML